MEATYFQYKPPQNISPGLIHESYIYQSRRKHFKTGAGTIQIRGGRGRMNKNGHKYHDFINFCQFLLTSGTVGVKLLSMLNDILKLRPSRVKNTCWDYFKVDTIYRI